MTDSLSKNSRLRVGLIGARRTRMGLGPFVARELRRCGAEIPCLLGTTLEGVDAASRALREEGARPRGYTDFAAMVEREALDAVAILSPKETHADYLRAAREAGLHALCEKPLLAVSSDEAAPERARREVEAFAARGLLLWENCQWPFTLPAYAALFPESDLPGRVPRSFHMRLAPTRRDGEMVEQVISHALSLLQAVCEVEEAQVEAIAFETLEPRGSRARFDFVTTRGTVASRVDMIPREGGEASMGYGFDDHFAERCVEPGTYALSFRRGERQVSVPDPLAEMIAAFTSALGQPRFAEEGWHPGLGIASRLAMLDRLHDAFQDGLD